MELYGHPYAQTQRCTHPTPHPCSPFFSSSTSSVFYGKLPLKSQTKTAGSNIEALSTPALALLVGIVEHELAAELVLHKIHLGADEGHNGLVVNHHLDAFRLHHLVELPDLLLPDVVHVVAQARTALLAQAYLDADLDRRSSTNELSFFSRMMSFSLPMAEVVCGKEGSTIFMKGWRWACEKGWAMILRSVPEKLLII